MLKSCANIEGCIQFKVITGALFKRMYFLKYLQQAIEFSTHEWQSCELPWHGREQGYMGEGNTASNFAQATLDFRRQFLPGIGMLHKYLTSDDKQVGAAVCATEDFALLSRRTFVVEVEEVSVCRQQLLIWKYGQHDQ